MKENDKLAIILQENKLDPTETVEAQKVFSPFFEEVERMKDACNSISITSIDQMEDMTKAREYRLMLQKIRTNGEREKDALKKIPLRKCQAIDALNRYLKAEIEPLEIHLKTQEKFIELERKRLKDRLGAERKIELSKYGSDFDSISLGQMSEDEYQGFLANSKDLYAFRKRKEAEEEEKKLEEERIEKEEQTRIKKENEQLKKEAEAKEKEREVEREAAQRQAAKVAAEAEVKLEAERVKSEKAEKELQAKRDEEARMKKEAEEKEAKERQEKEAKEKAERLAPDKVKLQKLAIEIAQLQMPNVESEEAVNIVMGCVGLLNKTSSYIEKEIINL